MLVLRVKNVLDLMKYGNPQVTQIVKSMILITTYIIYPLKWGTALY